MVMALPTETVSTKRKVKSSHSSSKALHAEKRINRAKIKGRSGKKAQKNGSQGMLTEKCSY